MSLEQKLWKKIKWFVLGVSCAFFGFWFSTLFDFNIERIKDMSSSVEIIAHRGGRGLGDENKMETFKKSVNAKTDRLEMDIQMTKDSKLFLFHDENFDQEVGIEGLVQDQNWEDIKDTGVPLFEDFMKWNQELNTPLNVEFKALKEGPEKTERTNLMIGKMISLVDQYGDRNLTVVSSFDPSILREVKKQAPSMKTALLLSLQRVEVRMLKDFDIIAVNESLLSRKYLLDLKSAKKEIWIWGVPSFDLSDKVLAMQIDGAIVDDPIFSRKIQEEYRDKSFQSKAYDQWRFLLE